MQIELFGFGCLNGAINYNKIPSMSRIRKIRKMRNLTAKKLAESIDAQQQQISKLENGGTNLTEEWMHRLAHGLDVAPFDFLDQGPLSAPVTIAVAAAFSDEKPDHFDLPRPWRRLSPPVTMANPLDVFSAEVYDDSAGKLYPEGSVLFATPPVQGEDLALGVKILVRRFLRNRADGATIEILVGRLDRTMTGDLVAVTVSLNPEIPAAVLIQPDRRDTDGFRERLTPIIPDRDAAVDYAPADDDPAEIIGVIRAAATPE